jgi:hypothetical protein
VDNAGAVVLLTLLTAHGSSLATARDSTTARSQEKIVGTITFSSTVSALLAGSRSSLPRRADSALGRHVVGEGSLGTLLAEGRGLPAQFKK